MCGVSHWLTPHFFMKQKLLFFISVCIFLQLQVAYVEAGWFGADFSAGLVLSSKQGKPMQGRMYVGAGRVRTEIEQNGQLSIEIIDPYEGKAWLLDRKRKLYSERSVPVLTADKANSYNPCAEIDGAKCTALGIEQLNGRTANKWLVRMGAHELLQWNDVKHGFPLQVVESGKIVMSRKYLGTETLEARQVERWKAVQYSENSLIESEQWYDPELNIAIRQVAKDGSMRQLTNIQVGAQNEALFLLPQGYRKIDVVAR